MLCGVSTPPRGGAARWEPAGDGGQRFVIHGDLDYSAHEHVRETLWTRAPGSVRRVDIDLGGVGFFDTSIARVLERYRVEAADREAHVRVVCASAVPLMVLRLAGLSALLGPDPQTA